MENGEPSFELVRAELSGKLMELGSHLEGYNDSIYAECIKWAMESVSAGNGKGCWFIGLAYEHGRGVEENQDEADEWFELGAKLGNASCMNNLGASLVNSGDEDAMKKGFEWCLKAAELGNGLAMKSVGICYQFGNGVEESIRKAAEWFEKAAEALDDDELRFKAMAFKTLPDFDED